MKVALLESKANYSSKRAINPNANRPSDFQVLNVLTKSIRYLLEI